MIDPSMNSAFKIKKRYPDLTGVEFEWEDDGRNAALVSPLGINLNSEQKQEILSLWLQIDTKDLRVSEMSAHGRQYFHSGLYIRSSRSS